MRHEHIVFIKSNIYYYLFFVLLLFDINGDVFEEMLTYIYYGEVNNFDYLADELVIAADKYRIEDLKMICEQKLISQISADNCIDLFKLYCI